MCSTTVHSFMSACRHWRVQLFNRIPSAGRVCVLLGCATITGVAMSVGMRTPACACVYLVCHARLFVGRHVRRASLNFWSVRSPSRASRRLPLVARCGVGVTRRSVARFPYCHRVRSLSVTCCRGIDRGAFVVLCRAHHFMCTVSVRDVSVRGSLARALVCSRRLACVQCVLRCVWLECRAYRAVARSSCAPVWLSGVYDRA